MRHIWKPSFFRTLIYLQDAAAVGVRTLLFPQEVARYMSCGPVDSTLRIFLLAIEVGI